MMINIIVIVIAVIAILSAVLIPTFSNVVKDAQNAADEADAKAIYTEYVAWAASEGLEVEEKVVIILETETSENTTTTKKIAVVENGQTLNIYTETDDITDNLGDAVVAIDNDDATTTDDKLNKLVFKVKTN